MVQIIQIPVGGFDNNFSYLLLCQKGSKKIGALIDPTGEKEKIEEVLQKNNAKVELVLLTHTHADHCELADYFTKHGAKLFSPKIGALGAVDEINFCETKIRAIHLPGHTKESVCFVVDNNLFSGDLLFVKGVGTTAYGGDDGELEKSLAFLSTLDKDTILWPGHNYGGASSTLGDALKNSHLRADKKVLELIKKKVEEYEKKFGGKKF